MKTRQQSLRERKSPPKSTAPIRARREETQTGACRECRIKHRYCSRGLPCTRCENLGLNCIYEDVKRRGRPPKRAPEKNSKEQVPESKQENKPTPPIHETPVELNLPNFNSNPIPSFQQVIEYSTDGMQRNLPPPTFERQEPLLCSESGWTRMYIHDNNLKNVQLPSISDLLKGKPTHFDNNTNHENLSYYRRLY